MCVSMCVCVCVCVYETRLGPETIPFGNGQALCHSSNRWVVGGVLSIPQYDSIDSRNVESSGRLAREVDRKI